MKYELCSSNQMDSIDLGDIMEKFRRGEVNTVKKTFKIEWRKLADSKHQYSPRFPPHYYPAGLHADSFNMLMIIKESDLVLHLCMDHFCCPSMLVINYPVQPLLDFVFCVQMVQTQWKVLKDVKRGTRHKPWMTNEKKSEHKNQTRGRRWGVSYSWWWNVSNFFYGRQKKNHFFLFMTNNSPCFFFLTLPIQILV